MPDSKKKKWISPNVTQFACDDDLLAAFAPKATEAEMAALKKLLTRRDCQEQLSEPPLRRRA